MQKVSLIFLINILLIFSSHGQSFLYDIILKQKEEAEKLDILNFGNQELFCKADGENGSSPSNNDELKVKCVTELCGSADKVENYEEMVEKVEDTDVKSSHGHFMDEYDQVAAQIFDLSIERNKLIQPILKGLIKNKDFGFSPKAKKLQNMMKILTEGFKFVISEYLIEDGNPIFDFVEKDGRYTVVLNEDNLKKNLDEKFKDGDPHGLRGALEKASRNKGFKVFVLVLAEVPIPAILNEMEGSNDWRETFKKLAIDSKKKIDGFRGEYGDFMDEEDLELIKENDLNNILNGQFPKQEQMSDNLLSFYLLGLFSDALSNPDKNPEYFKNFKGSDLALEQASLFDWDKRLAALNDTAKVKERKELDMAQCQAKRDFAIAALPTAKQVKGLSSIVDKTKNAFKNKVFTKFSSQSASVLSKEIDGMGFIPPMTQENYKKTILADMKDTLDELKDDIGHLKKGSGPKYEGVLLSEVPSSTDDDNYYDEESKLTDNIHDLMMDCDEYTPETLNDSFWPFKVGSIYISWNSVRSKDFGKGVLYHELGHAISPFFKSDELSGKSRGKYWDTRQCLDENHNMSPTEKEDQLYTEEDWADLIASVVSEDEDKNFGCFLLSQNENSYKGEHIHLKNPHEDDTHSADFFRILQVHLFQNNDYPKECKDLLAKEGDPYPKKNCKDNLDKKI